MTVNTLPKHTSITLFDHMHACGDISISKISYHYHDNYGKLYHDIDISIILHITK